jgi:hypothetical protein
VIVSSPTFDQVPDPLRPHAHEPNPEPPTPDATFLFVGPDGTQRNLGVADLKKLPVVTITGCYIVSTGHGTSGPFEFTGVRLFDLISSHLPEGISWSQVEVTSADNFGNRVFAAELTASEAAGRPIILAYIINRAEMTRRQGAVRMIVPSETDDALRQVKWVGRVEVKM